MNQGDRNGICEFDAASFNTTFLIATVLLGATSGTHVSTQKDHTDPDLVCMTPATHTHTHQRSPALSEEHTSHDLGRFWPALLIQEILKKHHWATKSWFILGPTASHGRTSSPLTVSVRRIKLRGTCDHSWTRRAQGTPHEPRGLRMGLLTPHGLSLKWVELRLGRVYSATHLSGRKWIDQ